MLCEKSWYRALTALSYRSRLLVLCTGLCIPTVHVAAQESAPAMLPIVKLEITPSSTESFGGHVTAPLYSIEIYETREAVYRGIGRVAVLGEQRTRIDDQSWKQLMATIAEFRSLNIADADSEVPAGCACAKAVVALRFDDMTKKYSFPLEMPWDYTAGFKPACMWPFKLLVNAINDAVGVYRWACPMEEGKCFWFPYARMPLDAPQESSDDSGIGADSSESGPPSGAVHEPLLVWEALPGRGCGPEGCMRFRLTVQHDGSVEYQGLQGVATLGTHTATLDWSHLLRLTTLLQKRKENDKFQGKETLEQRGRCIGPTRCVRYRFAFDGMHQTIALQPDCLRGFSDLVDDVHDLLNVYRWICPIDDPADKTTADPEICYSRYVSRSAIQSKNILPFPYRGHTQGQ